MAGCEGKGVDNPQPGDGLIELEKLWEGELHAWAKILESLNRETFVRVCSFMRVYDMCILGEVAERSIKVKRRLLGVIL